MVVCTLVVVSGRRIPAVVRVGAKIYSTRTRSSSGFSLLAVSAISARRSPVKFSRNYYNIMKLSLSLSLSLFMHTRIAVDIIHYFRTLPPPDCFWNLPDGSSFRVFERNLELEQARESFMKIRFQRHRNPTFEYVCFGFQHHFISFQALTLSKKTSN